MEFELLHTACDKIGVRYREANFVLCQTSALLFSLFFRAHLGPQKVSTTTRHSVQATCGLLLGIQAIGWEMWVLLLTSTVCYALMRTLGPGVVQRCVPTLALAYLFTVHIWFMILGKGVNNLDCIGPLMILTMKICCLAWSIHDGMKDESELTSLQKKMVIRKTPTVLEYYSFVLYPQCLLVGPVTYYSDYIKFIQGANFLVTRRDSEGREVLVYKEPSSFVAVTVKTFLSILFALGILFFMPRYPIKGTVDEDHLKNSSLVQKMTYAIIAVEASKCKYLFVWFFADAINNAAGMGFNGYDERGKPKWDAITNINLYNFEFSTSLKVLLDNWNRSAAVWLRYTCYERAKQHRELVTFLVSSLWHGFFPGYFSTFLTAFLMLSAAKKVRSNVRPLFQGTALSRRVYDFLTWAATFLTVAYTNPPFIMLTFELTIKHFNGMYWWLHLTALVVLVVLPSGKRKPSSRAVSTATEGKEEGLNGSTDHGSLAGAGIPRTGSGAPAAEAKKDL